MYRFFETVFFRNAKRLAILTAILFVVPSPGTANEKRPSLPPFTKADVPPAPDYSKKTSWLAKPEDPDQFDIDILWLYPTVLTGDSAWLMNISRKDLVASAELSIKTEARVFSGQANLYAPLYRQMNLAGFYLSEPERDAIVEYGVHDVRQAFEHYMQHYNKGRPFILAAHSQGSYLLTQLLVEYWGKIGIEDQLIAGYVVGWSITDEDLRDNPSIEICDAAHQTGCFVSYNSVAPGKQKESPVIFPGAIVVNPLTWTREDTLAPASRNRGSVFMEKNGTNQILPGFASARIANGGLEVVAEDPDRLKSKFFPEGVYHSYDYPLFAENISMNAAQRIQAYLLSGK